MTLFISRDALLEDIAAHHHHHSHEDPWWVSANQALLHDRLALDSELRTGGLTMGSLGQVAMTFVEMGAITSTDLFGLDELILFAFYWRNRGRYRRVLDLGANVGLHTSILARMGFSVIAYEPDPRHRELLDGHVDMNGVREWVTVVEAAVTPQGGQVHFIRVLGNTTGSHVSGAKGNPYGDLESFYVASTPFAETLPGTDLVKMDVEGLEADLLASVNTDLLSTVDVVCEVGSREAAERIWSLLSGTELRLFPQKVNWSRARSVEDLPTSHSEGSLFISSKSSMPWD